MWFILFSLFLVTSNSFAQYPGDDESALADPPAPKPAPTRPTRPSPTQPTQTKPSQLDDLDPIDEIDRSAEQLDRTARTAGVRARTPAAAFTFGLGGSINYASAPTFVTGAATGISGMGFGGLLLLDYDLRAASLGIRTTAGIKQLFVTQSGALPSGAIVAFPVSLVIQRLHRVHPIVNLRFGLGLSFDVFDLPSEVSTDNAFILAFELDLPRLFLGFRGLIYTLHPVNNFTSGELIAGIRF